jgi:hypothetical protein
MKLIILFLCLFSSLKGSIPYLQIANAGDGPLYKPVKYERKFPTLEFARSSMPQPGNDEYGRFFVMTNNFMITDAETNYDTPLINSWLKMKDKRWLTVAITHLAKYGIKKNDVVKYVDFQTGKTNSYTFKDKVNIALIPSEWYGESPDIPFHRTFYILLSDKIGDTKGFEVSNSDKVTGIGYVGNFYELLDTPLKFPDSKTVTEITSTVSKSLDLANYVRANSGSTEIPPKSIKTFSYEGMDFYEFEFNERPRKILNAVSPDGNYYLVGTSDMDSEHTNFYKEMIYFKNTLLFIRSFFDSNHGCMNLKMFKAGEFKEFVLECDGGGD